MQKAINLFNWTLHHGIKSIGHGNVIWKFQSSTGLGNNIKMNSGINRDHHTSTIIQSY